MRVTFERVDEEAVHSRYLVTADVEATTIEEAREAVQNGDYDEVEISDRLGVTLCPYDLDDATREPDLDTVAVPVASEPPQADPPKVFVYSYDGDNGTGAEVYVTEALACEAAAKDVRSYFEPPQDWLAPEVHRFAELCQEGRWPEAWDLYCEHNDGPLMVPNHGYFSVTEATPRTEVSR